MEIEVELCALTGVKIFVDRAGRQGILLTLNDEQTPWRLWCRDVQDLELWLKGLSQFAEHSLAQQPNKSACHNPTDQALPQAEPSCPSSAESVVNADLPAGGLEKGQLLRGAMGELLAEWSIRYTRRRRRQKTYQMHEVRKRSESIEQLNSLESVSLLYQKNGSQESERWLQEARLQMMVAYFSLKPPAPHAGGLEECASLSMELYIGSWRHVTCRRTGHRQRLRCQLFSSPLFCGSAEGLDDARNPAFQEQRGRRRDPIEAAAFLHILIP
ncbi:hypothetical protein Emed_004751 [Eimeria media]